MIIKSLILINIFALINCENESTDKLNDTLPQTNVTDGERQAKTGNLVDIIGNALGSAAAGAINSVSDDVVRTVVGNTLIRTGEYCGSRRGGRECDYLCRDLFRGPARGWCRSGFCACECDHYECERYCRRYWDDHYDDHYHDHDDYDYPRRRYRDGYCSETRGCVCD